MGSGQSSKPYKVQYHHKAVEELAALRDKRALKAILTIVDILARLGPKTVEPHSKAIKGARKLRELRPGGGQVAVRPIYLQLDAETFEVLAIGPEAIVDRKGFAAAVLRARERAKHDHGVDA